MTNDNKAVYGYCPKCGSAGISRERRVNGNDKCAKGHTYPSSQSLKTPHPQPMFDDQADAQVVALGDNPIMKDVARANEALSYVRSAVAQAVQQSGGDSVVYSLSMLSVGDRKEDQMLVYSPGGSGLRNANELLVRLEAATAQVKQLIENGAFS